MKKVSIIMPAYNAEKTIENTINSVLNQEYSKEYYELIVINDHSIDNTEQILIKYSKNYPDNIKYFNSPKDKKGVSSARNFALSKCKSKYVMFIDSDDIYDKKMVSTMVENIEKIDADMVACGYKRILVGRNRERELSLDEKEAINLEQVKKVLESLQSTGLFNQLWNKIFKLDLINDKKISFKESIAIGEDYRFILEYTMNCTKIKNINEILYYYYSNPNGLNLKHYEEKLAIKLDNLNFHKSLYNKHNLDTRYIDNLYLLTFLSGISDIIEHDNKKIAKEQISKYNNNLEIKNNIQEIYNKAENVKTKILAKIIIKKSDRYMFVLGKVMRILKKIYRKMKFE